MSDAAAIADRERRLNEEAAPHKGPPRRPKDAATLILLDRANGTPSVLMGRRHPGHKFMPGKFVFPGGAIDASDRFVAARGDLDAVSRRRLLALAPRATLSRARALALAAIRETFEETGLLLGARGKPARAEGPWSAFADNDVVPDLGAVRFFARAITPPGRPKRFDTRFFVAETSAIAGEVAGIVGPDAELVELVRLPLDEAIHLDLPVITRVILEVLAERIEAGLDPAVPVPFYRARRGRFEQLVLD